MENGTIRPLDVKKGDKVLFGKYSGVEVILDEKEYLVLSDDEIFGVIQ
jgi:chaperonin GroES